MGRNYEEKVKEIELEADLNFTKKSRFNNSKTQFSSIKKAKEFEEKLRAKLEPILLEFDCTIWTNIERIYETRWDCIFVQGRALLRGLVIT